MKLLLTSIEELQTLAGLQKPVVPAAPPPSDDAVKLATIYRALSEAGCGNLEALEAIRSLAARVKANSTEMQTRLLQDRADAMKLMDDAGVPQGMCVERVRGLLK